MKLPLVLATAFTLGLASSVALADALPPDAFPCETKNPGDSCTTDEGAAGTCTAEMCQSGHPLPDGGFESAEYACVLCAATSNCGGGSPETTACSGKSSGAPCTLNGANGVCVPVNCGPNAYACDTHQGGDDAGTADSGPTHATDAGDGAASSSGSDPSGGPSTPSSGQGTTTTSSSSGCNVGATDVGSGLALLAVLLPFLPFARRREGGRRSAPNRRRQA